MNLLIERQEQRGWLAQISDEDDAKFWDAVEVIRNRAGMGCVHTALEAILRDSPESIQFTIIDELTGKTYKVRPAECGRHGCLCIARIVEDLRAN